MYHSYLGVAAYQTLCKSGRGLKFVAPGRFRVVFAASQPPLAVQKKAQTQAFSSTLGINPLRIGGLSKSSAIVGGCTVKDDNCAHFLPGAHGVSDLAGAGDGPSPRPLGSLV